jgi:hypothetical protein
MHSKSFIIIGLIGINIWFGSAIVRLEGQRYALEQELCMLVTCPINSFPRPNSVVMELLIGLNVL